MSISLRVILIACSVLMLIYIARKIRKASLRIGDGIVWILMSVFFILISVFPGIIYWFCGLVGIMSPANFVYLLIIAFLLLLQFYAALRVSALESRIDRLAQEVALRDGRFMHLETEDDRSEKGRRADEPDPAGSRKEGRTDEPESGEPTAGGSPGAEKEMSG